MGNDSLTDVKELADQLKDHIKDDHFYLRDDIDDINSKIRELEKRIAALEKTAEKTAQEAHS